MSDGKLFKDYLSGVLPLVEDYLAKVEPHAAADVRTHLASDAADASPQPATPSELERYLYAPYAHFTRAGGKRTRPALCLLGAEAVGGSVEAALPVAAAVEHFQSAALIHDDIADEGETRRGEPCTYLSEGTGPAINMGDLGIVTTFCIVLADTSLEATTRLRLLGELADMELRTVEGQALDLGWVRDGRWDVSSEDYLRMATLKTAHYSAAVPLATGAICGGGSERQVEALRAFGMDAGLAFQIQDDLLNLVGDADAQGKDFRSDVTEGKRTLVATWALEHLEGGRREELRSLLDAHATDEASLARAVLLMDGAGAIEHARSVARGLSSRAKGHIEGVGLEDGPYETLLSMADFFVERQR